MHSTQEMESAVKSLQNKLKLIEVGTEETQVQIDHKREVNTQMDQGIAIFQRHAQNQEELRLYKEKEGM